ncbi:hypothetical protein M405DRAFT_858022 [Rhizopogon salebrosus TDB-379]|nr:hypothetical protein M405DRAFT_858022 [Rhizopogon salebrosus TDB-379]
MTACTWLLTSHEIWIAAGRLRCGYQSWYQQLDSALDYQTSPLSCKTSGPQCFPVQFQPTGCVLPTPQLWIRKPELDDSRLSADSPIAIEPPPRSTEFINIPHPSSSRLVVPLHPTQLTSYAFGVAASMDLSVLTRIANDHPNNLDSGPSPPSSVSPSYLRHRCQSKSASRHRSHITTDGSTSHFLARLNARGMKVAGLTPFLLLLSNASKQGPTVPTLLSAVHSSTLTDCARPPECSPAPAWAYHPSAPPPKPPPLETQMLSTATSKCHLACAPASSPIYLLALSTPPSSSNSHGKILQVIVQAQVSSCLPSSPTAIASPDSSTPPSNDEHARLDRFKIYAVTTQLNYTLSEIIASLDRTRLWTISCIRTNDSGSTNSFDDSYYCDIQKFDLDVNNFGFAWFG